MLYIIYWKLYNIMESGKQGGIKVDLDGYQANKQKTFKINI